MEESRQRTVVRTIDVGTEPSGCALTPNGTLLYVANHTEGTVAIIATASRTVVEKSMSGPSPMATRWRTDRMSSINIPGAPANELKSFTRNARTFNYLEDVGTFVQSRQHLSSTRRVTPQPER